MGERSLRTRRRRRQVAVEGEGANDRAEPFVGGRRLPRHHDETAARSQGAADVREGGVLVAEEHRREAADRHVERVVPERVDLGVAVDERHVGEPLRCGSRTGDGDHLPGQIDADDGTRRRRTGCVARRSAVAAPDVEDSLAGRDRRRRHQPGVVSALGALVEVGMGSPLDAFVAVPRCCLIAVHDRNHELVPTHHQTSCAANDIDPLRTICVTSRFPSKLFFADHGRKLDALPRSMLLGEFVGRPGQPIGGVCRRGGILEYIVCAGDSPGGSPSCPVGPPAPATWAACGSRRRRESSRR